MKTLGFFALLCLLLGVLTRANAFRMCSPTIGSCIPAIYGSPPGNDSQNCATNSPNPPFAWDSTGVEGAKSFIFLMADPTDNNYWVHWNVIDIPATTTSIAQGVAGTPKCPGKDNGNSWAAVGYAPPCGGPANTYTFTVYAMPNETTTGIDPMTMKANAIDTYLYNQGALAKATMSAVFLRDNVTACPNKPQVCNFGITNSTQSSGTQTSNSESNTNSNSNSQSSSQVTGATQTVNHEQTVSAATRSSDFFNALAGLLLSVAVVVTQQGLFLL